MIYLYAHTNFKTGLDSLRRVKVIYERLKKEGINSEILLNEYRAQLLAKDWGLPLATTIETIKDIDAVANKGDIVLIDSIEEIEGKVLNYPQNFKTIYINSNCKEVEFSGARVINLYKDGILALKYEKKEDRGAILVYKDSDYEKVIIKHLDEFRDLNLDLYWGIYFFVKYEDLLKEVFKNIVESEDFYEIYSNYTKIITSSFQIATEARYNDLEVVFWNVNKEDRECLKIMEDYGIRVVESIKDIKFLNNSKKVNKILNNLDSQIINIIKSYM